MSKATVLRCDKCQTWDSQETPVRTVSICGPRFELCAKCRVEILLREGVPLDAAVAYVTVFDQRGVKPGTHLTMATALKAFRTQQEAGTPVQPDVETEDDEGEELDETVTLQLVAKSDDGILTVAVPDSESSVDTPESDHAEVTALATAESEAETEKRPRRGSRAR